LRLSFDTVVLKLSKNHPVKFQNSTCKIRREIEFVQPYLKLTGIGHTGWGGVKNHQMINFEHFKFRS
jgi:hypothetical protein